MRGKGIPLKGSNYDIRAEGVSATLPSLYKPRTMQAIRRSKETIEIVFHSEEANHQGDAL